MAHSTPIVQDDTLIYHQDGQDHRLLVGTPAWSNWLTTASTFAFASEVGTFTARKERASNKRGGWYWKAYRIHHGKLFSIYAGKSEALTLERLKAVAATLGEKSAEYPTLDVLDDAPGHSDARSFATAHASRRPPASRHAIKKTFPMQLTPLLGREHEIAAIRDLLSCSDVRLLTLTGTGGVGKTSLAIHVAARMLDEFADGICFVSLAPISDPHLVIPTLAHTLGLGETGHRPLFEHLKLHLQDKHLLLLLDNFEQVVQAAPLLRELLEACPGLKALVTSREILRLQHEHRFSVPPLELPNLKQLPGIEILSQYAAIALFIQRAQSVRPDFQVTHDNIRAIAEICTHLDGLPLAIELAAARLRLLPPQQLLTRLEHRLQVLTGGTRDVPERQQTLRNTIRWSYNLLLPEEQRLFRRLAVFVGGCMLGAVEAVCQAVGDGAIDVLEGVTSLLDKNLLQQQELGDDEVRLLMLETIREYSWECLQENGETEATQRAHAAYYLALAEEAEPELQRALQVVWLERLGREYENLRAALLWLLEQADTERALRLSGALTRFWLVRGYLSEGRTFLERALAGKGEAGAPVRAKALFGAGRLAMFQNDYGRLAALSEEVQALSRVWTDKGDIASSLGIQGFATYLRGDQVAARALYEESLHLFREVGDQWGIADVLSLLATEALGRADYVSARALHQELGNQRDIIYGGNLRLLGEVALHQGDYTRACSLAAESLAICRELGYQWGIAHALGVLGEVALQQGDDTTARSLLEESLALFREFKDVQGITRGLSGLGCVAFSQGDMGTAYALYEELLKMLEELGDRQSIARCLEQLGRVVAVQESVGASHVSKEAWRSSALWAARLWGAAEALRETIGTPVSSVEQTSDERAVASVHTRLGEEAFTSAWAEGRTLTPRQALSAEAQKTTPGPTSVTSPPSTRTSFSPVYPAGLTAREVEVLHLLAQGLTNPQIAKQLVISSLTVSAHLRSIYSKIGVTSRSAATRYAVEHQLI